MDKKEDVEGSSSKKEPSRDTEPEPKPISSAVTDELDGKGLNNNDSPEDAITQEKEAAESSDDEQPEKAPVVVEKPLKDALPPPPKMTKWQMYKAYKAAKKRAAAENPKEKKASALKNFLRILTFGTKLDYCLMGACVITAIGSGIAMPLMFVVFGRLVGNFTGYFTPGSGVSEAAFKHQVIQNTLYMVYIGIARFGLSFISLFCVRMSGIRISARLRLIYMQALFKQPVSTIDATSPGKISTRLTTNSNTIQMGISQQLATLVQSLALFIGLYITSFIKGPLLTLVASASIPFSLLIFFSCVPVVFGNQRKSEKLKEKASALAFEIFESVRIVAAFGAEGRLAKAHLKYLEEGRAIDKKSGPFMGMLMAPLMFGSYATFALTFWFGIKQVTHGHLDGIGSITGKVLFSVNFAASSIGRLIGPLMMMIRAASAAAEIFDTLDTPVPDMSGLKDPDVSAVEDIVFKDVNFTYPSRQDSLILNKLNLRFETGKTTAIVGPSGSGKSTIVGLIQRWYEPNEPKTDETASAPDSEKEKADGSSSALTDSPGVFIGSINLNKIDIKWWRLNIGLVQQEPFLFNDTIFNNVANGLSGTKWNDISKEEKLEMVKNACKEAFATEFILKLPEGYETMVGESGIKLSGGQRQRLAIARAIIKQPPILILDEATSAIDVRTERIVQKALDRVSENRTTITIAHRLSTIKRADKIIVLRAGEVVEQGSHNKLLENPDGVYSGLVRAQQLEMGSDEFEEGIQQDETEQIREEEELERKLSQVEKPKAWKERGVIRSFGFLMWEQKHRWKLYTIALIACIAIGASYPLQSYLFAHLVDVFTLTGHALVTKGNFWSLMFFILACAVGIAYWVMGWVFHLISHAVSTNYRQEYLQNVLDKKIVFFDGEGRSPGTLTSELSTNATQLQELLGTNMGLASTSIFNLIGSIIISFYFGWKLALVGVLTCMPVVLTAGYFRIKLERGFEKLNAGVFAESSQFGSEAVAAYRTVTSLQMEDKIITRFDVLLKAHVQEAYRRARYMTLIFAFSDSADIFCQALVFYYGGTLLAKREYAITSYFVIYMSAIQAAQAAGTWFSFAPNLSQATAAANRILAVRPTAAEKVTKPPMPHGDGAIGITFENVNFSYADRSVSVLKNLNLKIEPGQFAALVGATGCGKSTIISLLERFYDPTGGRIMFGDTSVVDVDPRTYRKNLSLVAQESTLYEGTVRENVALSVDEAEATDEAIERACRSAQIHDFISSLADGYNTLIGPRGIQLSGGQRQRVALARALLRKPQLLLLDEATSNLDSESEAYVQRAIEQAAGEGGRTVIAVAHRLATIQNANIIFVIGSGSVLEQGTHAELLAKRGVYFQMCQAQALDR